MRFGKFRTGKYYRGKEGNIPGNPPKGHYWLEAGNNLFILQKDQPATPEGPPNFPDDMSMYDTEIRGSVNPHHVHKPISGADAYSRWEKEREI